MFNMKGDFQSNDAASSATTKSLTMTGDVCKGLWMANPDQTTTECEEILLVNEFVLTYDKATSQVLNIKILT